MSVIPRSLLLLLACRNLKLRCITECLRLVGPIDKHEDAIRLLLGLEDNLKAVPLVASSIIGMRTPSLRNEHPGCYRGAEHETGIYLYQRIGVNAG